MWSAPILKCLIVKENNECSLVTTLQVEMTEFQTKRSV